MDEKYNIKELNSNCYDLNDYIKLISQLKPTNINKFELKDILDSLHDNHKIFILSDNDKIIGSITFLLEQKIIHDGKFVLHVEDVIIDNTYRGINLGKQLLDFSKDYAVKHNCYKIILNCNDNVKKFYNKSGFSETNVQMSIYL